MAPVPVLKRLRKVGNRLNGRQTGRETGGTGIRPQEARYMHYGISVNLPISRYSELGAAALNLTEITFLGELPVLNVHN